MSKKLLYAAQMTAFDKDGNINLDGIRALVRYNIDVNKVDGLSLIHISEPTRP